MQDWAAARLSCWLCAVAVFVAGCGGRSPHGTPPSPPPPPLKQIASVSSVAPPEPTPAVVCAPAPARPTPRPATVTTANAGSDPSAQLVVSEARAGRQETFGYLRDGSHLVQAVPSLVTVYETKRFQPVLRIKTAYADNPEPPRVEYLAQAPDAIVIRSCAYDQSNQCSVEAYHLATGKRRFRIEYRAAHHHFDVAPSGHVFSGSVGRSIIVWDARTGRQKWRWPDPSPTLGGRVVYDPTGVRAAIPYPGGVELRSLRTGARLGTLGDPPTRQKTLEDMNVQEVQAAFDASGTKLYVGSYMSGVLEVWDVSTKRRLPDIVAPGLVSSVYAKGSTLVLRDAVGLVQIDTATDQVLVQRELGLGLGSTEIAWEAQRAAFSTDVGATVVDLSTGSAQPLPLTQSAWELELSPRGDQLVVGGGTEAATKVIDLGTGRTLATFDDPNTSAPEVLAMGQRYWVTRADETTSLWDLASASHVASFQTTSPSAALAPDESWVALEEATGIEVHCTSNPTLKWRAARAADWLVFDEHSHVLVSTSARGIEAYDTRTQKLIWRKPVSSAPLGLYTAGAAVIVHEKQSVEFALDVASGNRLPDSSIPSGALSVAGTGFSRTFVCAASSAWELDFDGLSNFGDLVKGHDFDADGYRQFKLTSDCSLLARPPGENWTDLWRVPAFIPFVQLISIDDRLLVARDVVSAGTRHDELGNEERYGVLPAPSGKHYLIGRAHGSAVSCASGARPLPFSACAGRIGFASELIGSAK